MIEKSENLAGTIDRAGLIELLQTNEVVIHFTKMDGTSREMFCTLDKTAIPTGSDSTIISDSDTGAIRVFDLDIYEWRSFHFDRVISIYINF